jgi:CheY-like chemotaxis protein
MKQNYNLAYIIDDDPIFVLMFKRILANTGCFSSIKNIENGQKALDLLTKSYEERKELPTIIFLDINMPVLNGWQFLEKVKKCNFKENLNIYMISSSIDKKEIEKSKRYSFVKNFISKPINGNFIEHLVY